MEEIHFATCCGVQNLTPTIFSLISCFSWSLGSCVCVDIGANVDVGVNVIVGANVSVGIGVGEGDDTAIGIPIDFSNSRL